MFKLQDSGWNICRQRIARIEAREACVTDFELILIAQALDIRVQDLLPKLDPTEPVYNELSRLLNGQVKTLMPPEDILTARSAQLLLPHVHGRILSRTVDKNDSVAAVPSSEDEYRTDRTAAASKQAA